MKEILTAIAILVSTVLISQTTKVDTVKNELNTVIIKHTDKGNIVNLKHMFENNVETYQHNGKTYFIREKIRVKSKSHDGHKHE
jgi:cell division protein FtsL